MRKKNKKKHTEIFTVFGFHQHCGQYFPYFYFLLPLPKFTLMNIIIYKIRNKHLLKIKEAVHNYHMTQKSQSGVFIEMITYVDRKTVIKMFIAILILFFKNRNNTNVL